MYRIIDLNFLGLKEAIASFLVETKDGPVLIETGPYSTFDSLEAGLQNHGYEVGQIKHVLLTHIHFDHAGAAWALAEHGATVHVHPAGFQHLHAPEKLVASATRIYGDDMERLWSTMKGIPENQLHPVADEESIKIGDKTFIPLHTPGHAQHHIAWQLDDVIFAGDVAGVKIENGPVVPPCPPPDIDLEAWTSSIDRILERQPRELVLTHYAGIDTVVEHMAQLKEELHAWADWIHERMDRYDQEKLTIEFQAFTAERMKAFGVKGDLVQVYEAANPSWMSVAGLTRYWKKRAG